MANLYVGADGVIHAGTGKGVKGAMPVNPCNRSVENIPSCRNSYYTNNCARASYVSVGRKVLFWIFSIIAGILMGIGLYYFVGESVFSQCDAETVIEDVKNWFWGLAPWFFLIGGCVGGMCYGIFCAEDRNYDLGAFILSAISSLGGIAAGAIVLAVLCLVVIIAIYIIGIMIVIGIIAGIIAGLEG